MPKKRMYVCPIEAAMDVIGGKWKPHILWKIKDAPLRFGAIQEKLPAISSKMLTRQLRALEKDRLVSRTEYPGMPPRVEYALTARGQTVIPLLNSLKEWARRGAGRPDQREPLTGFLGLYWIRVLYIPPQPQRSGLLQRCSVLKPELTLRRATGCISAAPAVGNLPDIPAASHHRAISANTPHPRYSRVYAA